MAEPAASLRSSAHLFGAEISVVFGGVRALGGVDLCLCEGEIAGLIGPNGSGKTTLLNVLSGFQKPREGSVHVGGRNMTSKSPRAFSRAGVGRTFQGVRVFRDMTVYENVVCGGLGAGASRRAAGSRARDLLRAIDLTSASEAYAGTLSYGQMRRVVLARTLATRPKFVLMDEPAAGLNDEESDELVAFVKWIVSDTGCAVLVVEHDMRVIMGVCERIQVLDAGVTIAVGTPAAIQADPAVREAYLGSDHEPNL